MKGSTRGMRMVLRRLAVLLIILLPSVAQGGEGDLHDAKVVVHLEPHATKNRCDLDRSISCEDEESWPISEGLLSKSYDLYPILLDIDAEVGITELRLGMYFEGKNLGIFDWVPCAEVAASKDWPSNTGAITFLFESRGCDAEANRAYVLGSFYVYAYTQTFLYFEGPGDSPGSAILKDCTNAETRIDSSCRPGEGGCFLGGAAFGTIMGINPCRDFGRPACCGAEGCYYRTHTSACGPGDPAMVSCEECTTAVLPRRWGSIKRRY